MSDNTINENIKIGTEEIQGAITKIFESVSTEENKIEFSEEFKKNASEVIESILNEELKSYEESAAEAIEEHEKLSAEVLEETIDEVIDKAIEESIHAISEEMEDKIDKYLSATVNEWIKENEIALEHGLKEEVARTTINQIREAITNLGIEIPEEQIDAYAELQEEVKEIKAEINKVVRENIELNETIDEYKRDAIINEISEDLTESQKEKLASLSESLTFDNDFRDKVELIKESYNFDRSSIANEDKDDRSILEENNDLDEKAVEDDNLNENINDPVIQEVQRLFRKQKANS